MVSQCTTSPSSFTTSFMIPNYKMFNEVFPSIFYLFLFLELCYDYTLADYLFGILQIYYFTLHLDASKAHNIAHTRIVNFLHLRMLCFWGHWMVFITSWQCLMFVTKNDDFPDVYLKEITSSLLLRNELMEWHFFLKLWQSVLLKR